MPKTKISEFSATPANNTDIDSINIAEGCAPSGINDAIRELMAQLKDFQTGAQGDSFNGPIGSTTPAAGAFTTLSASSTATLSGLTASTALALDASKNVVSVTNTGTGNNVLATSPTLVTPILGTPTSATLTNATGLPISTGVSGLGTGVATFLATPSSANLAAALTDETGTGSAVFATSPTLVTPALGTPSSGTVTNLTGTASININGTVGATTATTGAFTTLTASSTLTVTGAGSIEGLTVGRGAGAVSTNTAVGASALAGANTGGFTTALGYQAGISNTSGQNTFVGANSGQYVTTGTRSTGVGVSTLGFNNGASSITVSDNTAIGHAALTVLTSGASNTAIGSYALQANTTASNNTAVGYQALYTTNTGANNVGIGFSAGYLNQSGTQCVFIGQNAGYSSTANNNTFVGERSGYTNTGAQNSFYGQYSGYGATTGTNNTFMGANAGSSMTSGGKNSILGGYDGNQDGLDIRTASNYVVLSDGDGNRQITMKEGQTLALDSAVPNAGTGITFPATQSASSNANTLDDYEEGTWSPSIGGSTTYSDQVGYYTKCGNVVTVTGRMQINSQAGNANTYQITNLPFTSKTTGNAKAGGGSVGVTSGLAISVISLQTYVEGNTTNMVFTYSASSATSNATATIFGNNADVYFVATYLTA